MAWIIFSGMTETVFYSYTFFLFNRFVYLNQSGNFRIKIETFHYTQCIH